MKECTAAGLRLPQYAVLEFNKRISAADSADRKTKLNLSKCELGDEQVPAVVSPPSKCFLFLNDLLPFYCNDDHS